MLQCLERSVSDSNVSLKFEFAGLLAMYQIELKQARDEARKRDEIRNGNPHLEGRSAVLANYLYRAIIESQFPFDDALRADWKAGLSYHYRDDATPEEKSRSGLQALAAIAPSQTVCSLFLDWCILS